MTLRIAMAGLARITRRSLEACLVVLVLTVAFAMVFARGAALTGRVALIVSGPSMEPAVSRGAAIIVEPVPVRSLEVGDLVSIRVGPQQVVFTHRIVRLVDGPDGLWIETKGDANAGPDPTLVAASAVIGRVVVAVSALGYVLAALSSLAGVGLVAGLGGILLSLIWALEGLEDPWSRPARPADARRPSLEPT
ncbi:MAG: signal peptidase I [Anaerolinea sp.]|nr:signal peptidase I [Anaerolinea sp.]